MQKYIISTNGEKKGSISANSRIDAIERYKSLLQRKGLSPDEEYEAELVPQNTKAQKAAQLKYSASQKKVLLRFDYRTEQALIEKLESVPSMQAYIKELIKKDL